MRHKKPGRKALPKSQRRSAKITFRATLALRKALDDKAEQEGKTLGTYIADVLQRETERSE
jgi:predicted HicB family RNase H-like nuclease